MEPTSEFVWYFAIGSMCNSISLSNRGLHPVESFPAEVIDYSIGWFGQMGMATAIPEEDGSFHGVLHKMHATEQSKLDQIESAYVKRACKCKLYDGS